MIRRMEQGVFGSARLKGLCREGCLLLAFAGVANSAAGQAHPALNGTVVDTTGAPVQGAQIEFRSSSGVKLTSSDEKGRFRVETAEAGGALVVSSPGFATVTRELHAHALGSNLQIVLTPAAALQRIEVQGNAAEFIPAAPSSQYEVSSETVQLAGSLAVDDVLREVPGFSTFRRSSSLFANPTSQGVSLRGVGASATSRSTVMLDGIPLNDPFGGWVYWARLPTEAIATMEVANGGASDLYGGGALGGVVNLRTRLEETAYANGEFSYGSMSTPDFSFAAGAPIGHWSVSGAGQAYQTEGYIAVPANQRGTVDTDIGSGVLSGLFEASRSLGERGRFFVRGSLFGDSSKNGTPLQRNDTTIPELDLGADWSTTEFGSFSARLYGSRELYHQTFSSIATGRDSETLTDVQRNPSQQVGFVGTWSRLLAERHKISAGLEAGDVRGHSQDYHPGTNPTLVDAGGRQHTFGFFAQDAFLFASGWLLTFGGRVDTWNNNTGYQNTTPTTGTPTMNTFPNRTETAFSPRVSLLKSLAHGTAVNASVYRAFRAPTLNELYRNFRVGNVLTLANPALTGEHLTGGEIGLSQLLWTNRLTLRGNFFWSDIGDPVANVTQSSTPALITREKENLGITQARGFELSGETHATTHIQVAAAYLFVNSTVLSYPVPPTGVSLVGLRLPQVPQNQFGVQVSYVDRNWTAGIQGRFLGDEFDDDQNQFPLGRAFSLDAQVSRKLGRGVSLFVAAQNLTNDRFNTAATPVFLVGAPIFVRGGVRFAWH